MKPETEAWLRLADQDIDMAEAAWERGHYPACVANCEQALEKLLKAGLVDRGVRFRKTHDLPELAGLLGLELDPEQMSFLAKLTEQYLPSRYGDVYIEYSRETAENYYKRTKDLYAWLRQRLT
jgi:HEPN domain-containing protein